jgi:hypothetical protein
MPQANAELKCRMAWISIARRYGACGLRSVGRHIARSYRFDSQSIFSQLRQPLFTVCGYSSPTGTWFPEEESVNDSLKSAATTHLKVVCLSLIVSIIVIVAAIAAPGTLTSAAWSMP